MNQSEIVRLNPDALFDGEAFGMSQVSVDPGSGLVFLSGQVAWDSQGQVQGEDYVAQTAFALKNLDAALGAAGCRREDVLRLRIYVRGEVAEHLQEVVPPLRTFFGEVRPSITGLGVASLATPDTLVELE
ncbi:MAG: RidA family protein, partial [Myxococcota bacterium]